ncbi:MAG: AAA family ATPase [Thomasclavelia sp.]
MNNYREASTETIEEKTLVLLDEPETHLHPPLVSSFIRCLSELLMSTNAVAIIATHSPIILQEVPKNCVWILDRSGWNCSISRPRFETFGESYNNLVEEVFGLEIQKSGFHKMIADEVDKLNNYDELIEKFGNQLGGDADIIARTLFLQKEDNNEA